MENGQDQINEVTYSGRIQILYLTPLGNLKILEYSLSSLTYELIEKISKKRLMKRVFQIRVFVESSEGNCWETVYDRTTDDFPANIIHNALLNAELKAEEKPEIPSGVWYFLHWGNTDIYGPDWRNGML